MSSFASMVNTSILDVGFSCHSTDDKSCKLRDPQHTIQNRLILF